MDTQIEVVRPHSGAAGAGHAPRRGPEFHVPSLDGIRAASFLLVFAAHAGLDRIIPGGFGVTVFFFLSGFLITTLLRMEHEKTGAVSLKHFYFRRVLRIWPPFYLILGLGILAHLAVETTPFSAKAILAQGLHFTNYWSLYRPDLPPPSGTGVYWSLAVEEHFYLLFPFLFILLQRKLLKRYGTQAALLFGLCGLVLAWRLALIVGWHANWTRTYFASDTRIDSILFGCALALGANPALSTGTAGPSRLRRHLGLGVGIAGLLFSFSYRAEWFRDTARYTVQGLALMPVFVAAIREPDWGPFRILNRPWVRHIGVLSYSLYLLHAIVLNTLRAATPLSPLMCALAGLAIALLIAEGIHRWIEKPCGRLRRRFAVVKTAGAGDIPGATPAATAMIAPSRAPMAFPAQG